MEVEYWDGIFQDWAKMPVSCYKSIFEQAKERFNEVMEESQTITKKAMQALLVYITTLSSITSIILSPNHPSEIFELKTLLITSLATGLFGITLLIKLLRPKEVFYKGSSPKETFTQSANNNLVGDEFEQNFFYDEIVRYQKKIETLDKNNRSRIELYNYVLTISILLIGASIFLIIHLFL